MGNTVSAKVSIFAGWELGFARARVHNARGYLAVERTAEEIRNFQLRMAMDAAEELTGDGT